MEVEWISVWMENKKLNSVRLLMMWYFNLNEGGKKIHKTDTA